MQHDGRFHGDMDRNEVEMDLNKFMAMVEEIGALKDKIRDLCFQNLLRSWSWNNYEIWWFEWNPRRWWDFEVYEKVTSNKHKNHGWY